MILKSLEGIGLIEFGKSHEISACYSGKFKGYNANIRLYRNKKKIVFNLSSKWKTIDDEIQAGLMQELLCKLLKIKKKTINIDLYHSFLKGVHISIPKNKTDPVLEESFNRINAKYFDGMLDLPNLAWINNSKKFRWKRTRKFGSYDYGTDTICISDVFQKANSSAKIEILQEARDYVMYHEMLHKDMKFSSKNGRSSYHSPEFRRKENMFNNSAEIEKNLKKI